MRGRVALGITVDDRNRYEYVMLYVSRRYKVVCGVQFDPGQPTTHNKLSISSHSGMIYDTLDITMNNNKSYMLHDIQQYHSNIIYNIRNIYDDVYILHSVSSYIILLYISHDTHSNTYRISYNNTIHVHCNMIYSIVHRVHDDTVCVYISMCSVYNHTYSIHQYILYD